MKLTLEGQEAMLYFLDPGESICGNYLEFLHKREIRLFSPLVYLSIIYLQYGFMDVYLMLVYNPILLYLFSAQIAPALDVYCEFFSWLSCPFDVPSLLWEDL